MNNGENLRLKNEKFRMKVTRKKNIVWNSNDIE
jgi:hypothetical protein